MQVVTASLDGTAIVWRVDGQGQPVVLLGHEGPINTAAFSPDGACIVTASDDGTARVWSADGHGGSFLLEKHEDCMLVAAAFSPDGSYIVTASGSERGQSDFPEPGEARIWQADGQGKATVLAGHTNEITTVAFSPDGAWILTTDNRSTRVWRSDGGGDSIVFSGNVAAFSPDCTRIATAEEAVQVWRTDGQNDEIVLAGHKGHKDKVWTAAFSPDGSRVVTSSYDGTARVWRADGYGEPVVLKCGDRAQFVAGPGPIEGAVFSPDGRRVLMFRRRLMDDCAAWLWQADGTGDAIVFHSKSEFHAVAFSPDGNYIVTAGTEVKIWQTNGPGEPLVLRSHTGTVVSAAFSADGSRILTCSLDKTACVWYVHGVNGSLLLRGREEGVNTAAFSPDGLRVVTGSSDGTARVWRVDGSGEPIVLRGHERCVNTAAFSPDGLRVVTASYDGTVRVWMADGSGEPLILRGAWQVATAVFSPDGTHIVTASITEDTAPTEIIIWRDDGGQSLVLKHQTGLVSAASLSPDGTRLITGSMTPKHAARVWHVRPRSESLAAAVSWSLTPEERMTLLGETETEAWERFAVSERRYGRTASGLDANRASSE